MRIISLVLLLLMATPVGAVVKPLYLHGNSSPGTLDRTPPTTTDTITISSQGASADYVLSPAIQQQMTLTAGTIDVFVWLYRGPNVPPTRDVTVSLLCSTCTNTTLATLGPATLNLGVGAANASLWQWQLTLAADEVVPAGATLTLRVTNASGPPGRLLSVMNRNAGTDSRVELDVSATTVIDIDSIAAYDAAYAGGAIPSAFNVGATAYIRAVVSDPFGSYDIAPAGGGTVPIVTITHDGTATDVVSAQDMTEVDDSGAATKTFEYEWDIPDPGGLTGDHTIEVTAYEGTETSGGVPDVSDTDTGAMRVGVPSITVSKLSMVQSDPLGQGSYHLSGSVIQYTVSITNSGDGAAETDSVYIDDALPAEMEFYIGNDCTDAITVSTNTAGVSFDCSTDLVFANDGVPTFDYDPYVSPPDQYDEDITHFRVTLNDQFAENPATFTFRVQGRIE